MVVNINSKKWLTDNFENMRVQPLENDQISVSLPFVYDLSFLYSVSVKGQDFKFWGLKSMDVTVDTEEDAYHVLQERVIERLDGGSDDGGLRLYCPKNGQKKDLVNCHEVYKTIHRSDAEHNHSAVNQIHMVWLKISAPENENDVLPVVQYVDFEEQHTHLLGTGMAQPRKLNVSPLFLS